MLTKKEKDFLMAQVDSAITASIKLFGATGSETGTYLLTAAFIKGQMKRERLGEKKLADMADGIKRRGCKVKIFGGDAGMIEFQFNINHIALTQEQSRLIVDQIEIRKGLTSAMMFARLQEKIKAGPLTSESIEVIINEAAAACKKSAQENLDVVRVKLKQLGSNQPKPQDDERSFEQLLEDTKNLVEADAARAFKEIERTLKEFREGNEK